MKVELIYDQNCPNIAMARIELLKAFSKANLPAKWLEWDRNSMDSPEYVRRYGSPTILINGKDCVDATPTFKNCCRIYVDEAEKLHKVPTVAMLLSAFKAVTSSGSFSTYIKHISWKRLFAALPSIFIVFLPKLTCPLCWPAYAAVLSSLGIVFTNYTPYLLPLTLVFLLITLLSLGFRAKQRQGFGPFYLGIVSAFIIVMGKFLFHYDVALYVGASLLVIASLWNSWPKRQATSCKQCN